MPNEWYGLIALGILFVAIFIGFPISFTLIAVAEGAREKHKDFVTAAAPVGAAVPTDKFFLGRPVPVEQKTDNPLPSERAMLIVRRVKPSGFSGNLSLAALDDKIAVFSAEKPSAGEKPLTLPLEMTTGSIAPNGRKLFVQGMKQSAAARDTGLRLGLKGIADEGDAVKLTAVYVEAVSNVETAKLKTVAVVPEKPERKTKSKFAPAPIIMGKDYDVELRPHLEGGVAKAWAWSSTSTSASAVTPARSIARSGTAAASPRRLRGRWQFRLPPSTEFQPAGCFGRSPPMRRRNGILR